MADLIDITFLRHGRSRADDEGVYEGRYDSPLTEVGLAQSRARAEGWRQAAVKFDLVVCSTLQRARCVAEIIAGQLGAPIEADPDWMEVDHGPLAGMSREEAEKRYPRPAFRGPYEGIAGSGESEVDLHMRAARAVQNIIRRSLSTPNPSRFLVVAHGGILNAALREILNVPHPVNFQGVWFRFSDLGYIRLTYDPARHVWIVREMIND